VKGNVSGGMWGREQTWGTVISLETGTGVRGVEGREKVLESCEKTGRPPFPAPGEQKGRAGSGLRERKRKQSGGPVTCRGQGDCTASGAVNESGRA